MSLQEQLEHERRIINAATPGPWENEGWGEISQHWSRPEPWKPVVSKEVLCGTYCMGGSADGVIETADADFIVHARTSLPQRNAQLQAVLELVREQQAQGYNAVSLDRLTRAIEEATP